jgi:hypothetical protein
VVSYLIYAGKKLVGWAERREAQQPIFKGISASSLDEAQRNPGNYHL